MKGGYGRRHRHSNDRREQVVRRVSRPPRHRPDGRARRKGRDLRSVRVRKIHGRPLHQPAGGASVRPHHCRWRGADRSEGERRGDPRRGRHGVPAVQPLPAFDGAGEPDPRPDEGAWDEPPRRDRARHALSRTGPHPRAGRQAPGAAFRRSAAARGHRAQPLHGAEDHAFRRAHIGAGPGDDLRSTRRDGGAGGGGDDHGGRHP